MNTEEKHNVSVCQYIDTDTQSHSGDPFYCLFLCNMCSDALSALLYCSQHSSRSTFYIIHRLLRASITIIPQRSGEQWKQKCLYLSNVIALPRSIVLAKTLCKCFDPDVALV